MNSLMLLVFMVSSPVLAHYANMLAGFKSEETIREPSVLNGKKHENCSGLCLLKSIIVQSTEKLLWMPVIPLVTWVVPVIIGNSQTCMSDDDCNNEFYCDNDGHCNPRGQIGDPCTTNNQCHPELICTELPGNWSQCISKTNTSNITVASSTPQSSIQNNPTIESTEQSSLFPTIVLSSTSLPETSIIGKATTIITSSKSYDNNYPEGLLMIRSTTPRYEEQKLQGCAENWKLFRDKCYRKFNSSGFSHDEAEHTCNENEATLVMITDEDVHNFLHKSFDLHGPFWIGLIKDGDVWKWADKTELKYKRWGKKEHQPYHRCAYEDGWTQDWHAADCSQSMYFVRSFDYVCQKKIMVLEKNIVL